MNALGEDGIFESVIAENITIGDNLYWKIRTERGGQRFAAPMESKIVLPSATVPTNCLHYDTEVLVVVSIFEHGYKAVGANNFPENS